MAVSVDDIESILSGSSAAPPKPAGPSVDDIQSILGGDQEDPVAILNEKADKYGLPRDVFLGLNKVESGMNPAAKSAKSSATGPTQVTQGALTDYNRANGTNLQLGDLKGWRNGGEVGAWYLSTRPGATIQDKLAAYNQGAQGMATGGAAVRQAGRNYAGMVQQAAPAAGGPSVDDIASILGSASGVPAAAADDLTPPQGADTPLPPDTSVIAPELASSNQQIQDSIGQIRRLKNYVQPVGDQLMTPGQANQARRSGDLTAMGLTPRQQLGIQSSNNINMETEKHLIMNEKSLQENLQKAQALAAKTGRTPELQDAVANIPPPIAQDGILKGSLMTLIDWASRPLSVTTGVVGGALEGESGADIVQEAKDAALGRRKSDMTRVLTAAGVPALGTYDAGQTPAGAVLGLLQGGDTTFTGRGVLGQVMNLWADPLMYVSAGTARATELGSGLRLSAKGDKYIADAIAAAKSAAGGTFDEAAQATTRQAAEESLRLAVDQGDMSVVAKGGLHYAGYTIPGTPEVGQAMRDVTKAASEAITNTRAGAAARGQIEKLAAAFDQYAPVKQYKELVQDHQGFLGAVKGEVQDLKDQANVIFAGIHNDDAKRIFYAIDSSPFDGNAAIDAMEPKLQKAAYNVMNLQTAWRNEEISLGLGEGFLDGYMMRKYANWPTMKVRAEKVMGISTGMGSINRTRALADMPITEIMEKLPDLKLASDNAKDLFIMRGISSIRAQNAQKFLTKTVQRYGTQMTGDFWKDIAYMQKHDMVPAPRIDGEGLFDEAVPPEGAAPVAPTAAAETPEQELTRLKAENADLQKQQPTPPPDASVANTLAKAAQDTTAAVPPAAEENPFAKAKAGWGSRGAIGEDIRGEKIDSKLPSDQQMMDAREAMAKLREERRAQAAPPPEPPPAEPPPAAAPPPPPEGPFPGYGDDVMGEEMNPRGGMMGGKPPQPQMMIPRAIADLMYATGDRASASALWRGFDKVTGAWKTSVTSPFLGFHVRNAMDNTARAFLDVGISAIDPRKHAEAIRILRGEEGRFITALGEEFNYETIRRAWRMNGLENAFQGRLELPGTYDALSAGRDIPKISQIRGARDLHILERSKEFGNTIENEARMHLFASHVRRGETFDVAAAKVKQVLNDYDNLTSFEKTYLRRAVPFYTFTRKSVPLQVRLLAREPGRYGALLAMFATPGDQALIESDRQRHPDYAMQGLARQVGTDRNGNPLYFWLSGLSMEDLGRIIPQSRASGNRGYEWVRQNVLAMLHPLARAAVEEIANKDLYLDRPLDDINTMYDVYGKVLKDAPKPIRDFIGFKTEINGRGEDVYKMNPRALHLVRSFMMSRMYSTIGKVFDERKDLGTRALNFATGMRFGTVDALTQDLPAYRKRGQERQMAGVEIEKQEQRQYMFNRPGMNDVEGPSLTANEAMGAPNKPDLPTAKQASRAVPDVSKDLRRGETKGVDLADIARRYAQQWVGGGQ